MLDIPENPRTKGTDSNGISGDEFVADDSKFQEHLELNRVLSIEFYNSMSTPANINGYDTNFNFIKSTTSSIFDIHIYIINKIIINDKLGNVIQYIYHNLADLMYLTYANDSPKDLSDIMTHKDYDNGDIIKLRPKYQVVINAVDVNHQLNYDNTIADVNTIDARVHENVLNSTIDYNATNNADLSCDEYIVSENLSDLIDKLSKAAVTTYTCNITTTINVNTWNNELNLFSHSGSTLEKQIEVEKNIAFSNYNTFSTTKIDCRIMTINYISLKISVKVYSEFIILSNVIQLFYGMANSLISMQLTYIATNKFQAYLECNIFGNKNNCSLTLIFGIFLGSISPFYFFFFV